MCNDIQEICFTFQISERLFPSLLLDLLTNHSLFHSLIHTCFERVLIPVIHRMLYRILPLELIPKGSGYRHTYRPMTYPVVAFVLFLSLRLFPFHSPTKLLCLSISSRDRSAPSYLLNQIMLQ